MTTNVPKLKILGINVSCLTIPLTVQTILKGIQDKQQKTVICRDSRGLVLCQDDPVFRKYHEEASLVTPDGIPLFWLLKMHSKTNVERVCGTDLLLSLCRASENLQVTHYFYGATKSVNEKLILNLKSKYPNLKVAGYHSPPFRSLTYEENAEDIRNINLSMANILWIGLGSPKQEYWMGEHASKLDVSAIITVGAAFDFVAGTIPRAPKFLQSMGLEWAFRLLLEPKRLWRRNFVDNRRFLGMLMRDALNKKIR